MGRRTAPSCTLAQADAAGAGLPGRQRGRGLCGGGSGVDVRVREADARALRLRAAGQGLQGPAAAVPDEGDGAVAGAGDAAHRAAGGYRADRGPARPGAGRGSCGWTRCIRATWTAARVYEINLVGEVTQCKFLGAVEACNGTQAGGPAKQRAGHVLGGCGRYKVLRGTFGRLF